MKTLIILMTTLMLVSEATAQEELIVYVSPKEAKAVIERNEMQYEEYKWHSVKGRMRIAKINTELLKKSGAKIQVSAFDDVLPIGFSSKGINGSKWQGTRTQDSVPEATIRDAATGDQDTFNLLNRLLNQANLNIEHVIKDPETGEYLVVPTNYEEIPIGHAVGERFGNTPVLREDVNVITKVYGTIVADPSAGMSGRDIWHEYTIKPLNNDVEYVIIYEWDKSKDHHLMEPPHDPEAFAQSEIGQKYQKLREDKEAHMARVATRIANRNKHKEPQR